jgi:nitrogenase molybdenum-cofactor synthesis protein NifE
MGMDVVATGTSKSTEEDKARIRELMGQDAVMIDDGNPRALIKIVHDQKVDILIAGGRTMYTALKARIPFLDINQERDFGYEGYTGMLELARQIALTIESPVWEKVRRPRPWAKTVTANVATSNSEQASVSTEADTTHAVSASGVV